ncbi:hypothetical protein GWI33_009720, partial [Rhynchophorus ferrugineus]
MSLLRHLFETPVPEKNEERRETTVHVTITPIGIRIRDPRASHRPRRPSTQHMIGSVQ